MISFRIKWHQTENSGMKNVFIILILLVLKSSAQEDVKTIDSSVNRILIINSFNAMSVKVRKNKRELLRELTDSLKNYLAKEIWFQIHGQTEIISGIIDETGSPDSLINSLLEKNNATKAILIKATDVFFEEGDPKVVQEYGQKDKTMHPYNLCTKIKYILYQKNVLCIYKMMLKNGFLREPT